MENEIGETICEEKDCDVGALKAKLNTRMKMGSKLSMIFKWIRFVAMAHGQGLYVCKHGTR
ncbi:unnamed protein product [Ilex paraguariensis]|uniref:Uncharacterized protein n=1 Tax=Ilex paraguariensis TaxID=185542 RepID=A0ABC8RD99_9AQUA